MAVIKGNRKKSEHPDIPLSERSAKLPKKPHLFKAFQTQKGQTIYMKQIKPFGVSPTPEQKPPPQKKITPSHTPPPQVTQQVPNIVAEKEKLLAKANQEINHYKEKEFQSIEQEKKIIFDEAHQDGFEQGKNEATQELASLIQDFKQAINSIETEKKKIFNNAQPGIVDLGFAIAEKIIQKELNQDSHIFQNILHEAITRVTEKDKVIVKINTDDYEAAQNYKTSFKKELSEFKHIDFTIDAEVERGGCIIETNMGFIDASIPTKFSMIQKAFEKLEDSRSEPTQDIEPITESEPDISNHDESLGNRENDSDNDDFNDIDFDDFEDE